MAVDVPKTCKEAAKQRFEAFLNSRRSLQLRHLNSSASIDRKIHHAGYIVLYKSCNSYSSRCFRPNSERRAARLVGVLLSELAG